MSTAEHPTHEASHLVCVCRTVPFPTHRYDLETKCRIMISGTPVQNQLSEFFALLDFCMPNCLGTAKEFNKAYGRPIERARDLRATDKDKERGTEASAKFGAIVSAVMLRRNNDVIAKCAADRPSLRRVRAPRSRSAERGAVANSCACNACAGTFRASTTSPFFARSQTNSNGCTLRPYELPCKTLTERRRNESMCARVVVVDCAAEWLRRP